MKMEFKISEMEELELDELNEILEELILEDLEVNGYLED